MKALQDLLGGQFTVLKEAEAEKKRKTVEEETRAEAARRAKEEQDAKNQKGGSCIIGSSQVLMADFTTKNACDIKRGDIVLDQNLQPVRVIGCNFTYLGSRSLYSFGDHGPIFTGEHQFVSADGGTVVVDLRALHEENPQLKEEDVYEMNEKSKVLKLKNTKRFQTVDVSLKKHENYVEETKVYFIEVEGDGTYIVDNFLAKHEMPNLQKWPLTFLAIGLTVQRLNVPEDQSFEYHSRDLALLVMII